MKNNMVSPENQKKMLIDMLKYIDGICRQNNIKYSLIAGSLIGAIRHKGFIPWDDDVDIVLDYENYNKLMGILKNTRSDDYDCLFPGQDGYPLRFAKLINKHTTLREAGLIDEIKNYGLFLDIFCYLNVPNDEKERQKHFKKLSFLGKCLVKVKLNYNNPSFGKKIVRLSKNFINLIFGNRFFLNKILKLQTKYMDIKTNYVMSDNPVYGYKKEVQKAENIKKYIDASFEGIKVMIFENYDEILKNTYGDYMKLPPESERVNHSLTVYYKE